MKHIKNQRWNCWRTRIGVGIGLLLLLGIVGCAPIVPPSPESPTPRSTSTRIVFPPTWTPTPEPDRTPTATPRGIASATPLPTATSGATIPPPPTTFPPITLASEETNLPLPANLIYLEDGLLKWLDRRTDAVETLTDPEGEAYNGIQQIAVDDAGRFAVISRKGFVRGLELILLDFGEEEEIWRLEIDTPTLMTLTISPDGNWVAYIAEDDDIAILPTIQPENIVVLGKCPPNCTGLLWRPDSGFFVWSSDQGIYGSAPIVGGEANLQKLAEPPVRTISPATFGAYGLESWSPDGTYLLLSQDVKTWLVLHPASGRVEPLPGEPAVYVSPDLSVFWLLNEQIGVLRSVLRTEQAQDASLTVYRLRPGADEMFQVFTTYTLGESASDVPFGAFQVGENELLFGVVNYSSPSYVDVNGLYLYFFDANAAVKRTNLPAGRIREVIWSPDGEVALIFGSQGTLLVPVESDGLFSLQTLFRQNACCFYWIP